MHIILTFKPVNIRIRLQLGSYGSAFLILRNGDNSILVGDIYYGIKKQFNFKTYAKQNR